MQRSIPITKIATRICLLTAASFLAIVGIIGLNTLHKERYLAPTPFSFNSQGDAYGGYNSAVEKLAKDPHQMWYGFHPIEAMRMLPNTRATAQTAAPLGPMGNLVWTNVGTATNTNTLRGLDMLTLTTGTPTVNTTYTTDTATSLCGLWPFVASQNAAGFTWDWWLKNTAGSSLTITLAGGTGVTIVGTATVAQNAIKHFKVNVGSCSGTPAATIYSLGSSTF